MTALPSTPWLSRSARATERFAARLSARLRPGDVVALVGGLGAGKTCFCRGLARGLGVPPTVPITSPTFTVMNAYAGGRLPVYHFDLYRLSDLDELEAVGYRDFVGGDGVALLEWADRVPDGLPERYIEVRLEDGARPTERLICVRTVDRSSKGE